MVYNADEDPPEDWNWLRGGPDPYWESWAESDPEVAESFKQHRPEIYYSWDWTPLPEDGEVENQWWNYPWTPNKPENSTE